MISDFTVITSAEVDDALWFTVIAIAGKESELWIRMQDKNLWAEVTGSSFITIFDVHSELLMIMKLKWASIAPYITLY